jgi:hypothetical protein
MAYYDNEPNNSRLLPQSCLTLQIPPSPATTMDFRLQGPPHIPYESKPRRLIPTALGLDSAANNSQSVPMHSVYSGSMGHTYRNSWETSPLSAGRLPGTVTLLPSPQMCSFGFGNSPPRMSLQSKPVFDPNLDDVKYAHPLQEATGVPIPSLYMSHNPAQPSQVPVVHFEDSKVAMGEKWYASMLGLNSGHQGPAWTAIPVAYDQVTSPGLCRVPLQIWGRINLVKGGDMTNHSGIIPILFRLFPSSYLLSLSVNRTSTDSSGLLSHWFLLSFDSIPCTILTQNQRRK